MPLVTFDFDSTLTRPAVQKYAKQLMSEGVDVWVVTSRFDELQKNRFPHNPTNDDLWKVIDKLGIPRWKVRFTNMESKSLYLQHTKAIWHLDDDEIELEEIWHTCKTAGFNVKKRYWKTNCNDLLKFIAEKQ